MARSAGNPQAMMQTMLQQDPRYRQAMQLVQASGGDARSAFYKLAKERGVDPEQVIQALR